MPHCPECKKQISVPKFQRVEANDAKELYAPIVVAYCPNCECILGIASQQLCLAQ